MKKKTSNRQFWDFTALPESNRLIRIQASRKLWWWFYIAPSFGEKYDDWAIKYILSILRNDW